MAESIFKVTRYEIHMRRFDLHGTEFAASIQIIGEGRETVNLNFAVSDTITVENNWDPRSKIGNMVFRHHVLPVVVDMMRRFGARPVFCLINDEQHGADRIWGSSGSIEPESGGHIEPES